MNATGFITEVIKAIRENRLSVFFGAGVSFESGIPVVTQLVPKILSSLGINREIVDRIVAKDIPFEKLVESIGKETDITRLLDVFKSDRPSRPHHFLSQLVAQSCVNRLYTTNFDELLEHSLRLTSLPEEKDLIVAADIRSLSNIDMSPERPMLVKLHGTISKKEEIGIMLNAIAANAVVDAMKDVLKPLFNGSPDSSILIMGYSCSDIFDITPAIESWVSSPTQIFFVDHRKSLPWAQASVERIGTKVEKNPFANYNGYRLCADTSDVMSQLWDNIFPYVNQLNSQAVGADSWEYIIDDWAGSVLGLYGKVISTYISSSLLIHSGDYEFARNEIHKSLEREWSSELASRLAYTYQEEGKLEKAADLYSQAVDDSNRSKDILGFLQYSGQLSEVVRLQGKAKPAMDMLLENQRVFERLASEHPEIRQVGNGVMTDIQLGQLIYLGSAYYDLKMLDEATSSYERAREIALSTGNKEIESYALAALGHVLQKQGKDRESIEIRYQGRTISQKIGNLAVKNKIDFNILKERLFIRGDDPAQDTYKDKMFYRTDHKIQQSQQHLLVELSYILDKVNEMGKTKATRKLEALPDITCWECGHSFPVLQNLRPPPEILNCPQCHSSLMAYQKP